MSNKKMNHTRQVRAMAESIVLATCVWFVAAGLDARFASAQINPDADYQSVEIFPAMDTRMPDVDKEDRERYREVIKARSEAIKARNNARGIVLAILNSNDGVRLSEHETTFTAWFERVIFAEMTQTDRESLRGIPKLRERFFMDYFERPAKNTPLDVRDRLLKMTRNRMLDIIRIREDDKEKNFHPAVRFNAMLILGKLNSKEAVTIGEKSAPVPWLQVLGDLLREYKNEKQIDEVRMATILGMLRHAEMDGQRPADQRMKAEARILVINEMVDLVRMADPPKGRTLAGHRWMQSRAVEVLGAFRDPGPGNIVLTEIERILDDEKLPITLRCTAAVAYGMLIFQPADAAAPSERVLRLARLASFACKQEIAHLDEEAKAIAKRDGEIGDDEEMDPDVRKKMLAELDPYKVTASRRMLKYCIQSVQLGVGKNDDTGYRRYSKAEPHKEFVSKVDGALENLMKATDKPKEQKTLTADFLVKELDENIRELDRLILAAAPKKPADADGKPVGIPPIDDTKLTEPPKIPSGAPPVP